MGNSSNWYICFPFFYPFVFGLRLSQTADTLFWLLKLNHLQQKKIPHCTCVPAKLIKGIFTISYIPNPHS
ncbi:hypothetical protein BJX64DRAFT_256616, partial [Aspergillus heterothallicus]